ncbi:cystathionine beta-synthase [Streptomyces sp. NPDC090303]|uniref:cystathionine beta-synthase n=1 Tax=Streptomyces sp. NPDC090303 TaxID=3365960 RepID=UPI0037FEDBB9
MQFHESMLGLVGNTPLVRLNHVTAGIRATVLAKVEYFNPGGSTKDRIALRLVEAAEASGALKPGGTIIEPTSGNTGVGLAIVAQQKGYRCIFVCRDKVSTEKIDVMRAYGAEVVVCPTAVAPDHPDHYHNVSDRLVRETDGAWKPDQYSNPDNPRSHYESTGPELWEQTDGRITHFVAGIGTGGTLSGTGRYLREVSHGEVQVIGADPEGSVYSGGSGRPYLVEGVGEDFWPTTYDPSIANRVLMVPDKDSFLMARRLAREEGMLVGGSGGMAVHAALEVARELGPADVVVALLPDSGRGYLSKIFNDAWMADYGFLKTTGSATVADVLRHQHDGLLSLVHMHPNETIGQAIEVLRGFGVSQMPVVKPAAGHPDVMAAEVVGSIVERRLTHALFTRAASPQDTIQDHMSGPLPQLGAGQPVADLMTALGSADAAVVVVAGKPTHMVTGQDLLTFLAAAGGSRSGIEI